METRVLVLKQGYLKKLPNQTKLGSSLKRSERRWVTFGLTREQQPYLAFYANEESSTTTAPLKAIPLRTCCHITKSLNLKGHTNVFTMTLADRQLSLMAPTMDQMDEWCRILDTTLKSLGILKPDENLYTVQVSPQPQLRNRHSPTPDINRRLSAPLPGPPSSASSNSLGSRDPSSPLPPAPAPRTGRLPAPPPGSVADFCQPSSAAAPSTCLPAGLSLYLHENEMNQRHQAEVAAASGEVYEAVWDRSSCQASGGGVQSATTTMSSSATSSATMFSSAAASGASSPPTSAATLQQPPPIPQRTRIGASNNNNTDTTTIRPRPSLRARNSTDANANSTRPAAPLPAETDYGVIWTDSSSSPCATNTTTTTGSAGRGSVGGNTGGAVSHNGILPPRYSEQDDSFAMSRPANLTSPAYPSGPGSPAAVVAQGTPSLVSRPPVSSPSPLSPLVVSTTSPPYTPPPSGAMGYSFSPAPVGHQVTPSSPLSVLPNKMMEALGISGTEGSTPQHTSGSGNPDPQVYGWNAPPLDDHDAPPPYMPRSVANRGPQKSLKESQVEGLQKEMNHAGGVKVTLRRNDCHLTIAWVDCGGSTWIAGWNQKARPFLHNAFRVGDQVVSINGQVVENGRMAHKLIKHSEEQAKITFILKRVPQARVFALKRNEDGEDLGFRREGGTGEITDVVPFSVAERHGVPARAPTLDGRSLCNWFITEINMRPINLFFKEDEIEKRLNAVGRDISVLIQPIDFVNEMKTQLKKNLKNYKDFIVQ